MPKIRVHVVKIGDDFFVQPGIVSGDKNDTLRIINNTTEELLFRFTTSGVVDPNDQTKFVGANARETVSFVASPTLGAHSYQIIMLGSGKKAKGNSDPVLIIDN
jgi:hypothetical protein